MTRSSLRHEGAKNFAQAELPFCWTPGMHLMYYLADGKRVYTLKKVAPDGAPTKSAHPARFSPDDKFSRHRVTIKKRFGLLLTQQAPVPV